MASTLDTDFKAISGDLSPEDFGKQLTEFLAQAESKKDLLPEGGDDGAEGEVSIQGQKIVVKNTGWWPGGNYRVEIHNPFLQELLMITDVATIISVAAISSVAGPAGPVISTAIAVLITIRKRDIQRADKGRGIVINVSKGEMSALVAGFALPTGPATISAWAYAKKIETL